jgi:hypothetical protein
MKVKNYCIFCSNFILSQTVKGKVVLLTITILMLKSSMQIKRTYSLRYKWRLFSTKPNDILVFISKGYELKNHHQPKIITENQLIVELILKAEELNEITLQKCHR